MNLSIQGYAPQGELWTLFRGKSCGMKPNLSQSDSHS